MTGRTLPACRSACSSMTPEAQAKGSTPGGAVVGLPGLGVLGHGWRLLQHLLCIRLLHHLYICGYVKQFQQVHPVSEDAVDSRRGFNE